MAREAIALARRDRPDLILATKAPFLGGESVRAQRRCGAPVAMIYPDSPYGAYTQRADVLGTLAACDRVYIWGRHLVSQLSADGVASATYLPFAFDPGDYGVDGPGVTPPCGRAHAIAFVGQRYDKREAGLAALGGVDVGVWGPGRAGSDGAPAAGHCGPAEPVPGAGAAPVSR